MNQKNKIQNGGTVPKNKKTTTSYKKGGMLSMQLPIIIGKDKVLGNQYAENTFKDTTHTTIKDSMINLEGKPLGYMTNYASSGGSSSSVRKIIAGGMTGSKPTKKPNTKKTSGGASKPNKKKSIKKI